MLPHVEQQPTIRRVDEAPLRCRRRAGALPRCAVRHERIRDFITPLLLGIALDASFSARLR
jgi:hypothetical protein